MSHLQSVVIRDKNSTVVAGFLCGALSVIAVFRGVFSESYWSLALWTLSAAFIEEIIFRRWIMMQLSRWLGFTWGVGLSSLIFTAAHVPVYGASFALIAIFLSSVCLSFAYMASGSLALVTAVHGLENLTVRMSHTANSSACAEVLTLTCVQIAGAINIATWCALSLIFFLYSIKMRQQNSPWKEKAM